MEIEGPRGMYHCEVHEDKTLTCSDGWIELDGHWSHYYDEEDCGVA
jgi:hypothetical protein